MDIPTIELETYICNGSEVFTQASAQRILGISHPTKFREHLEALGLRGQRITWDIIRLVLASRLFVMAGNGKHTKRQFAQIYRSGLMDAALTRFHINLEQEFQRIRDGYYQRKTA